MAQLLASTIDGNLTVNGLATFSDGASTRQGLNYIGTDPVNANTDTPTTWKALGTGIAYIQTSGIIANQPYQYGFIENRVAGNSVSQTFTSMSGLGAVYRREGDASGWYSGSAGWVRVIDKNFVYDRIWDGTCEPGNTMTDIPKLLDYRLYAIYMSGQGSVILGLRYAEDYIRGIGGYANNNNTNFTYHFGGTIGTDKKSINVISCNYIYHNGSSNHSANNTGLTITEMCGIV